MNLDVLVFAAHPDDAELSMGGTIAKLTNAGLKVGIIDFTRGELGTRGTIETRFEEAQKASEILKLALRDNLELPDGKIKFNQEYLLKIINKIRKHRPSIIFAPYKNDRHPDHIGSSQLVKEAMFFTGLPKIETFEGDELQEAYRPKRLFYYMQTYDFTPTFIVDISDTFKTKMESVKVYATQFHNPNSNSDEPETFISQPGFVKYLETRAGLYGFKIGKEFGEPFYSEEDIELDIINFLKEL